MQSSISASINDSMIETRRRQRATVTGGESTLDDDSGYTRAFRSEDQRVCLWNLANTKLHPRSVFPAFRLLGLFPDTETALAHAQQVVAADSVCALHLVETHGWYTIPSGGVTDVDLVAKVNRNLLRHQEMLQSHASEFKDRHDALTAGRKPAIEQARAAAEQAQRDERQRDKRRAIYTAAVDQDDATVRELQMQYANDMVEEAYEEVKAQAKLEDAESGNGEAKIPPVPYVEPKLVPPPDPEHLNANWSTAVEHLTGTPPPVLNRMLEVRNQRYAVVSIVNDYETCTADNPVGHEPGIIVWAAFDTEAEALRYNKCVASKQVRDHDLAIVSMYEWLYPHMMLSDAVTQLYRNTELDAIMRHARTASKKVQEFREQCERDEIAVPTIEIDPDLTEPVQHTHAPPCQ